jgi:hypothetical protein
MDIQEPLFSVFVLAHTVMIVGFAFWLWAEATRIYVLVTDSQHKRKIEQLAGLAELERAKVHNPVPSEGQAEPMTERQKEVFKEPAACHEIGILTGGVEAGNSA